jgi:hypothetical protein
LSAVGAKFEVAGDGTLIAKDNQGKALESMQTQATLGGLNYTLKFEVSPDQEHLDVYFHSTSETPAILRASGVNQDCALNNLLWGLGTGALTGGAAGVPGVVIGGLTGAIFSGIQSATSC